MAVSEAFRHVEARRTVVFGSGALVRGTELLGGGYVLLTTSRAAAVVPSVIERAGSVVYVPHGPVDVVAAQIRSGVTGDRLVALGGGRVIDVAKALAAADGPREVAAIPTSLSGAEMTGVHRHAKGVPDSAPRVRPAVVLNDPDLSASQPEHALAASSANALGHATTALFSDRATPISQAVGREAIQRLAGGWSGDRPDRPGLALGALLAGWAVDHSGLGPHHALAQSAVRVASLEHARTNAALLPATIGAVRARRPVEMKRLDALLGVPLESVARLLRDRSRADLGVLETDPQLLSRVIDVAARRPELALIPPALDPAEIRAIYCMSASHEA